MSFRARPGPSSVPQHPALAVLIVLTLFAAGLLFVPGPSQALTAHPPIKITSDADFAKQAAAKGWPGSGTKSDPYIIEGYAITSKTTNGIEIANTRVHFILRDNTVDGQGGTTFGILLSAVKNVVMEGNSVQKTALCIYLRGVVGGTIRDNSATDCINAYSIVSAHQNLISANTATNSRIGYYMAHSDRNTLSGNSASGTSERSIYIHNGIENTITGNRFTDAAEAAVYLRATSGNSIRDNEISGTPLGVWIADDPDNLIEANRIRDTERGIAIATIGGVTLKGNHIHGATTAIDLQNSDGNILRDNVIENSSAGIDLFFADDTLIDGGSIRNTTTGILGFNAMHNTITGVALQGNNIGIHLKSSRQSTLSHLDATGNTQAVRLDSNRDHVIEENAFDGNTYAVTLSRGLKMELRHNRFDGNGLGLRLLDSDQNTIWNNRFDDLVNVEVTGNVRQTWNIAKTDGTNIVGGPHLGGNWWNDYEGVDLDEDGLGDVAHGPFPYNRAGSQQLASALATPYGPDDALPLMTERIQQDRV